MQDRYQHPLASAYKTVSSTQDASSRDNKKVSPDIAHCPLGGVSPGETTALQTHRQRTRGLSESDKILSDTIR